MLCEFCQYSILSENINLAEETAYCHRCQRMFDFELKPDCTQPKVVTVVEEDGKRFLEWQWFHFFVLLDLPFAICLNAFWIVWFSGLYFGWVDNPPEEHALLYLFGLFPLGMGLFWIYTDALVFINRSRITIDETHLTKTHGPLPWTGTISIPRNEITHFVCQTNTVSNDGIDYCIHSLIVILCNGMHMPLISHHLFHYSDRPILRNGGVPNRQAILWMKYQLENWCHMNAAARLPQK